MIFNEKQLAKAIMDKEKSIDLHSGLVKGVERIQHPSQVVWYSVAAALVSSAVFWGSPSAMALGVAVGLPTVLAASGGVGGIVFVTLGSTGTIFAFRLLIAAQTIDVLNDLRDKYELKNNVLNRK